MVGTAALLAFILSPNVISPVGDTGIEFRGHVPSVCTLSSSSALLDNGVVTARLSVFCNQREGSLVSGTLIGGDPAGYMIDNGRETVHVEPGAEFDIASYADAHAGLEILTVTPLSDGGQQPILMFDIRAEG